MERSDLGIRGWHTATRGLATKADAKDKQAVFDAAAAMYDQACQACHAQYLTEEETP